ncbi:TPA: hypothetical protein HA259_03960 [Thermoplasmata archaeon]|nr:hypothetical protein [Thermoplasmata archaeon]
MAGRTLVYAGAGSSHSWTWAADLLEKEAQWHTRFADEDEFVRSLSRGCTTAIVSGGDAYSIASALSGKGFSRLREFIGSGGRYIGICAGAYLPLPTSVPPLNEFNMCSTKIENLASAQGLSEPESPRFGVPYCDRLIIHPVRGEVVVTLTDVGARAPLYGGPIFSEPSEGRVIGRFSGFTESTEFQLAPGNAGEMMLGKPAVVEASHGDGRMLLLSPHLEHPGYPEANRLFMELTSLRQTEHRGGLTTHSVHTSPKEMLRRAVVDLSIAIRGLEGRSFLVGNKVWDSDRFLVLADAVRRRSSGLPEDEERELADRVLAVREDMLGMDDASSGGMQRVLGSMMAVARDCVNARFEELSSGR